MSETKGDHTKGRIKREAFKLFYMKGYENTSVREISDLSGLQNSGALYYHYGSKEEILIEGYKDIFKKLSEACDSKVDIKENMILNVFVSQYTHFNAFTITDEARRLYRDVIGKEWLDDIIIERNLQGYSYFIEQYGQNIDIKQYRLAVLETRGVESKLMMSYLNGKIKISKKELFNHICRVFPMLLGIKESEVSLELSRAYEISKSVKVDESIFLL